MKVTLPNINKDVHEYAKYVHEYAKYVHEYAKYVHEYAKYGLMAEELVLGQCDGFNQSSFLKATSVCPNINKE